jgi:hypothetical protein
MSDSNGDGLNITASRISKTQTTVTVRLGGDVLYVDKLDLGKRKAREAFAEQVCGECLGIDRAELDHLLMGIADTQAQQHGKPPGQSAGPSREELLDAMSPAVRQAARTMLEDPALISRILSDINAVGVAGERELSLTVYLIGTSRLLEHPLSGIVQGPTASGKSYTIGSVASLFPSEAVLLATQMTPQALFYMPPGGLVHKFVVAGERSRAENDDTAEATRALREMLSSGRLSKLIPMKIDGVMKTMLIEQEGPIAYVESTTLTHIFDEDANRCIQLTTDERSQQTRRIINAIAEKFASNGDAPKCWVMETHHAIQRMLEPLPVQIPFAPRLAEHFDDERVEARRAFPHFLSLVQASALLHQYQRQRDGDGHVLADANDYHLARWLLRGPLARQLGGALSDPAKRFIERLQPVFGNEAFSPRAVREHIKGCRSSIYGWLNELAEAGLAKVVEPPRGPNPAIWQFTGTAADVADHSMLPSTEELFR